MRHTKLVAGGLITFALACATNQSFTDPFADESVRAQGTIALGASHSPGSSVVTPSVSVSFMPDTTVGTASCGQTAVGTCVVTQAPDCTSTSCKNGETCGFDSGCNVACIPLCTMTCGTNQKCEFDGNGDMGCHAVQTFDAGAIAISGTNMSIAVYPPYAWKTTDEGSPFAPGASLRVQAAGPVGAGYVAFDQTFTATTFLQANPPLDQLNLDDVFGGSDLTLGWLPGNDRVYILATGVGASARCLADDTTGSFSVPRAVIDQVIGSTGVHALALSIERARLERNKGMTTVGSLDNQTIQPHAWLDLVTTSTESISLQACKSGQTSCGTKCVDTNTDSNNCGSCGSSCSGKACSSGTCQTSSGGSCSSCEATANTGTCASEYSSCTGSCKSLLTCVMACAGDTTCESNCYSTYSAGASAFDSYWSCLCGTACSSECSAQCSGS